MGNEQLIANSWNVQRFAHYDLIRGLDSTATIGDLQALKRGPSKDILHNLMSAYGHSTDIRLLKAIADFNRLFWCKDIRISKNSRTLQNRLMPNEIRLDNILEAPPSGSNCIYPGPQLGTTLMYFYALEMLSLHFDVSRLTLQVNPRFLDFLARVTTGLFEISEYRENHAQASVMAPVFRLSDDDVINALEVEHRFWNKKREEQIIARALAFAELKGSDPQYQVFLRLLPEHYTCVNLGLRCPASDKYGILANAYTGHPEAFYDLLRRTSVQKLIQLIEDSPPNTQFVVTSPVPEDLAPILESLGCVTYLYVPGQNCSGIDIDYELVTSLLASSRSAQFLTNNTGGSYIGRLTKPSISYVDMLYPLSMFIRPGDLVYGRLSATVNDLLASWSSTLLQTYDSFASALAFDHDFVNNILLSDLLGA